MPYKVVYRGDPSVPKSRLYACLECGAEEAFLLRETDPAPEHCGETMEYRISWVGGDDGLSGGFFYSDSMDKDFSSVKEMKDHVLANRRIKPGERFEKPDGSIGTGAPLYNESAEKVHGARNESHLGFGKTIYKG